MNRYHKKYLYDLDRVLERLFIMLDQREAAETDFQRDDTLRAAATHLTDRTVFFAKRMWERWQVAVPYLLPLLVEDRIRQDDYRTEVSWPFIQGVLRSSEKESQCQNLGENHRAARNQTAIAFPGRGRRQVA